MNIVRSCGGRCSVGNVICVMREMGQHHEIHDYRVSLESRYVGFRSSTSCQQLQSEDEDITLGMVIISYSQLLTGPNSRLNSFGMPASNSFAASQSRLPSQPPIFSLSQHFPHKKSEYQPEVSQQSLFDSNGLTDE